MLENKKIGLFITGSIAAYKMGELTRQLIKKGAQVRIAMTRSATEFIPPLTLQTLSRQHVLIDTFDEHDPQSIQHIDLADWLDYAVVVPASANILGKMANGIADEIVSSVLMAVNRPKIIVPAMNTKMWENPATIRNVLRLTADGAFVLEPATGFLAEGYEGKGRMPEIEEIIEYIEKIVTQTEREPVMMGQRVIITAGGTVERIDPVRYISNDSSGKMGYALAKAASYLGADVLLISTKPELPVPHGVEVEYVESASQMHEAILEDFDDADMVIMAAAVSDYRVANSADQKMKKQAGQSQLIELVENPDILADLGKRKTHQVTVGFAAETEDLLQNAQSKLERKQANWIIANDVSNPEIGFNSDENQVTMLSKDGDKISIQQMEKSTLAFRILNEITKI